MSAWLGVGLPGRVPQGARMRFAALVLASEVVLAACGTGRPDDVPPPPPAQPTEISGVNRLIHWTANGDSTAVGRAPYNVYVEADVPGGDVVPALLADDGSFTIPVAPTGPYWLRIVDGRELREDVNVYTDASPLGLGREEVGADGGVAGSNAREDLGD